MNCWSCIAQLLHITCSIVITAIDKFIFNKCVIIIELKISGLIVLVTFSLQCSIVWCTHWLTFLPSSSIPFISYVTITSPTPCSPILLLQRKCEPTYFIKAVTESGFYPVRKRNQEKCLLIQMIMWNANSFYHPSQPKAWYFLFSASLVV